MRCSQETDRKNPHTAKPFSTLPLQQNALKDWLRLFLLSSHLQAGVWPCSPARLLQGGDQLSPQSRALSGARHACPFCPSGRAFLSGAPPSSRLAPSLSVPQPPSLTPPHSRSISVGFVCFCSLLGDRATWHAEHFPDQRLNPCALHRKHRTLTTGPREKSLHF